MMLDHSPAITIAKTKMALAIWPNRKRESVWPDNEQMPNILKTRRFTRKISILIVIRGTWTKSNDKLILFLLDTSSDSVHHKHGVNSFKIIIYGKPLTKQTVYFLHAIECAQFYTLSMIYLAWSVRENVCPHYFRVGPFGASLLIFWNIHRR